jgi:hypothetical protein
MTVGTTDPVEAKLRNRQEKLGGMGWLDRPKEGRFESWDEEEKFVQDRENELRVILRVSQKNSCDSIGSECGSNQGSELANLISQY